MSKILYVGDPHVRPEDLGDCRTLINQVIRVALAEHVDQITILGDLHHNHAMVHTEVMEFWRAALGDIYHAMNKPIVLLVGNHDQPGDASSTSHALLAYQDMSGVVVVDKPKVIDNILYVPYCHSSAEFVTACNSHSTKVVVCHQEINGASVGGFFSKCELSPEVIPQETVVSGHIHEFQSFDKVLYLGASRWLTAADANADRKLTILTHLADGLISAQQNIQSDCRQLLRITDTPDCPFDILIPRNLEHRYLVDIVGPTAWIVKRMPLFSGWARIRSSCTDRAQVKVRESEGLGAALGRYLVGYKPTRGTSIETLKGLVDARISLI